jgi:hypothetical protein
MELLYLRQGSDPFQIQGAPSTVFADWQSMGEDIDGQELKKWSELDPDEVEIPAHIVGVTAPNENSSAMLLDTRPDVI